MSTTFGFKVTAGFPFTLRRHQPTRVSRSEKIVLVICLVALAILSLPDDYYATLWASPEFKVESATVTGLNTTGSELTAAWDITLLATNPFQKHRLSIHHLHAWVVRGDYSRIRIGETTLPPFDVNKRNQVNLKLAAASQWVGCDVGKEIYDGQRRGLVSFGVHVCGCYDIDLWFSLPVCFQVDCDRVYFGTFLNGTGNLMEQARCRVG